MKKFINEFKQFAMRGNMLDMAIGVIIGGAFTGIVTSLTDNFINPILNFFTGGRIYSLQDIAGFASSFISSVVNFLIMAFILFCLLKMFNRLMSIRKKEEPVAPKQNMSLLPIRNPYTSFTLSTLYITVRKIKTARTAYVAYSCSFFILHQRFQEYLIR